MKLGTLDEEYTALVGDWAKYKSPSSPGWVRNFIILLKAGESWVCQIRINHDDPVVLIADHAPTPEGAIRAVRHLVNHALMIEDLIRIGEKP